MPLDELILNKKKIQKGQSLLELVMAIAIFVVAVSGLSFFVLNSYVSGRLSYDTAKADFLAQEGIEAVSSIRDNKWDDLVTGSYALSLAGNHWSFNKSLSQEDISSQLQKGTRTIEVQDVDADRKKIISRVNWQFSPGRNEEEKITTYFTNWQKISAEIRRPLLVTDPSPKKTTNANLAIDQDPNTFATTPYDVSKDPSLYFSAWQAPSARYKSVTLNFRYHADAGSDDTYAVAIALDGCKGNFFALISPTAKGNADTTVTTSISPSQDFSKLCVKIYTKKNGSPDKVNIYTHDVWTEGSF